MSFTEEKNNGLMNNGKFRLPVIVIIIISIIFTFAGFILPVGKAHLYSSQEKKLTIGQILTGLNTEGKSPENKTLAARNKFIIQTIKKRGVDFTLIPEFEKELRKAGATEELIAAIRESIEKANATPTPPPILTPTAISTPTAEPTPTPEATPTPAPTPVPTPEQKSFTGNFGIEFIPIPAGEFMMGSNDGTASEKPVRPVTIKEGFWMGKYEITQGQWKAVMGSNPSSFDTCGDNCPVEFVSWNDVQEFLKKLNQKKSPYLYRLPSEAEWEYAARAGTTGKFAGRLDQIAWYGDTSGKEIIDAENLWATDQPNYEKKIAENGGRTHAVGTTPKPNPFGLFDMNGNVWEWVEDNFTPTYEGLGSDGSANTTVGDPNSKVIRGGAWNRPQYECRSSYRKKLLAIGGNKFTGFRLVAVLAGK